MVPVCQRGRWTTDYYRNKMIRQLELHLFPFVGDKNIRKTEGKGLIDILRGCRKNEQGRQSHDLYGQGVYRWMAEVYDLANMENSSFVPANSDRSIIRFLPLFFDEVFRTCVLSVV